ncbi:hypothetical protein KSC_089930 [Ktedonobacter sp. SOSP1-52]|uniref:helix-turn-helix domain-containing protein n=1 Tax=Ktedonobacter sp. SOSP1-52 TaxID=2778366 RepID=UPI001915FD01|nr:helix-turn-helix transcriptional regulator [Ktedonobacter sp. SOSP1-52]GHO70101.1 hypothetical protein KSC_089930 [Ktedonobacter sp. SOSP1-52]
MNLDHFFAEEKSDTIFNAGTVNKEQCAMKPNLHLKKERELRGWSQAKVASEIGVNLIA